MDLASLIGLIIAVGGMLVGFILEGGKVTSLIEVSAMVIVFGGSLGATIVGFSLKQSLGMPRIIKHVFFSKHMNPLETLNMIVGLARKAREIRYPRAGSRC